MATSEWTPERIEWMRQHCDNPLMGALRDALDEIERQRAEIAELKDNRTAIVQRLQRNCTQRANQREELARLNKRALEPSRLHMACIIANGLLSYSHVNPLHGNWVENCRPEYVAIDAVAYLDAIERELAKPRGTDSTDVQPEFASNADCGE